MTPLLSQRLHEISSPQHKPIFFNAKAKNAGLQGGNEADLLRGGLGRDERSSAAGADGFIFASAAEAGLAGQRDRTLGFSSPEDRLNLKAIAAAQTYLNCNPFDGDAGQARYDATTGNLQGDVNDDSVADYKINLGVGTVLAVGDLILQAGGKVHSAKPAIVGIGDGRAMPSQPPAIALLKPFAFCLTQTRRKVP